MYIKNKDALLRLPRGGALVGALEEALSAADPYKAVASHVKRAGGALEVAGRVYSVRGRAHVVGFGKASEKMAEALVDVLGDLAAGGVVISPRGSGRLGPVEVVKGDHPVPGADTLVASRRLLEYLEGVGENDVVFVVISGGGSALFEVPVEGVELGDIARISAELMRRGADIVELNAVRKRLSRVKGGKLLRLVKASAVISLIISDVVGDRLDTIASGPTAPDGTSREFAIRVLKKYGIWGELPPRIRAVFEGGEDTVKEGDALLAKVQNVIVANNLLSLRRASEYLSALGYKAVILTSMLEGEAREAGRVLASVAKSAAYSGLPERPPLALLAGGETVVTVRGGGRGGRNQELCLSFSIAVRGLRNISAACLGTDGVDGNSPAAGAVVDGGVAEEAEAMGLDPFEYLNNNDSYTFFEKLGRAVITGYTGTNVNDVFIALVEKVI
ncbi:glycerate kinase type-2 family protein [Pyrobaculum aerophilum]|uniref:glycerate kinase type-2 family protein n=2 Tax=Pyrobaculum aerophilum TaxID=13773 RepID=UPI0023F3987C|nr:MULTISPECIES: glycerate kinase [Pyrobaculum]MCX8135637.1 glycerate kinase [Pyrobaculum aerophilum]